MNEDKVINTLQGNENGQNKCPKCGATDITLNERTGLLRCNYCRFEFPNKVISETEEVNTITGQSVGVGASDVVGGKDIITLKCSSCGAEVVIDTSQVTNARCHWCRNVLSINEQVPNGAVPDIVLPFKITKEEARNNIEEFVKKRKFFAHPKFKEEFTTENIMGVYFPYMVVDVNSHASFSGEGEHLVRSYMVGSDDNRHTEYDADLYKIEREFDLSIKGLTIESNSDRLNRDSSDKTNNIINSIMPFDTENATKWDANYLRGYTSEKRDTNVSDLEPLVEAQSRDIARYAANETLTYYDRGVRWDYQKLDIKGSRWKAAYLPVWLYSYQQVSGNKKILHYVAVNARTKETMGSVPIHLPKLIIVSCIVEVIGFILMLLASDFDYSFLFLALGFVFFFVMYSKYRNKSARHKYEVETDKTMENVLKTDNLITRRTGLTNSSMVGANNRFVSNMKFVKKSGDKNEKS